jgi:hypothetical protein
MRIYQSTLRGCAREETGAEIGNGGGGEEEELVNSKKPHFSLIYLLNKGTWAETWRTERKRQPTDGQGEAKLLRYPCNGSRTIRMTYG